MKGRQPIPEPMKREIRQRCGFGCVICGFPLYEYEHILGYANVQRHVPNEITLLCDLHHREKTAGLLPLQSVILANKNPYNFRDKVSKPYTLHFSGKFCETIIGKNKFSTLDKGSGTFIIPLEVDGIALVAFVLQDGYLSFYLQLFDHIGQPILIILANELVYSTSPWDIELIGRNLIIRERKNKITIDITFEAPNRICINRGTFYCNGVKITIKQNQILINNVDTSFSGVQFLDTYAGIVIGRVSTVTNCVYRIYDIPRYQYLIK